MQLRITSRKKFTVLLCALGLISIVAIYPRQTVNFFYSTAIQIKDYIHFYGYRPVKRRTKNAKAFHDKCENFSFRASNETAVLITAFYSLHGDHLGYG